MSKFWRPGSEKPSASLVDDEEGGVLFLPNSTSSSSSGFGYASLERLRQRLPVYKYRKAILYLVERHATTIVVGETGSGKSTQIPQYLMEAGWAEGGRLIGCTQPRRLAVQSVASRVAEEVGVKLGEEVGYTIRFEDQTNPGMTKIKFLTDGVLIREMMDDPLLTKYSVIMIDEAHERSISTDILLGLLKKIQRRRPELRIIISSATIEARAMSTFFSIRRKNSLLESADGVPNPEPAILSVEGRGYTVETHYVEEPVSDYLQAVVNTVLIIHEKGFFTLLSLVACVPLGELFFFHMILIRKGITTYDYVVAMRAMSEGLPEDEEGANIIYSPSNSATTGFSVGSSLGLHHKGAWCTPPRIFIDHDEVIPHLDPGMVPSTVDPDAAGYAERANKSKKPVKISARSLAKLDRNEVMKAAAKARASSSVLRPIDARHGHEADISSSGNASVRSSMSVDYNGTKESRSEMRLSPLQSSYPQSLASQDDYETGTQTASSLSSPVHIHRLATHTQFRAAPHPAPPPPERPVPAITRPPPVPSTQITNPMFQSATSYVRENRRASVVWDQEAGRYVSVLAQTRPGGPGLELPARNPSFLANPSGEPGNHGRNLAPANTSSSVIPPGQPSERLTYTGQSIFFGGPILSTTGINAERNEAGTRGRPEASRDPNQRDIRGERARTGSFPLFEPGKF